MKNNKTAGNLDEMQDQKMLKMEEYGYWILFWGLALAVVVVIAALYRPVLHGWDEASQKWFPRIRLFLVLPLSSLPNAAMFCLYGRRFFE